MTHFTSPTTAVAGNGKSRFCCQITKDRKVFDDLPLWVSDSHVPPLSTLYPDLFPKEIYQIIDEYLKSSVNLLHEYRAVSPKTGITVQWSFFHDFYKRLAWFLIPIDKCKNVPEMTVIAFRKKPADANVAPPVLLRFKNVSETDHFAFPFHIFSAKEGEKGVQPVLCENPLRVEMDYVNERIHIHHLLFLPNPSKMKKLDPEAECITLVHLIEHWEETENGSTIPTLSPEQLRSYQTRLVSSLPLVRNVTSASKGTLMKGYALQK